MRRLDGMSAWMLYELGPASYTHTLKIMTLDYAQFETPFDFQRYRDGVAARIDRIPILRWKYRRVPFGLHHPVWVDDRDFDIDYHLRRIVCPPPADKRAFCELVSQIYSWPLDESKPLWQVWAVEGLPDKKVALVMLLSHAYADGQGTMLLLQRMLSEVPDSPPPVRRNEDPPWQPEPEPSQLRLLWDALRELPLTWARNLPNLVRGIAAQRRLEREAREGLRELPPNPMKDAQPSALNMLLSSRRTFVYETFPMPLIRRISRGFGVTINDLLAAAAAGACRRLLTDLGADPDGGPLVATVPIGRRPPADQDDGIGNMVSADFMYLPVHLADPLKRLVAARHSGDVMKAHFKAAIGIDLASILELTPRAVIRLLGWYLRRKQGKSSMFGHLALSNVPGPRRRLYLGRAPIDEWISIGHILAPTALNCTAWSYADNFTITILADQKLLPDGWVLIAYFREALAEYAQLLEQAQANAPGAQPLLPERETQRRAA